MSTHGSTTDERTAPRHSNATVGGPAWTSCRRPAAAACSRVFCAIARGYWVWWWSSPGLIAWRCWRRPSRHTTGALRTCSTASLVSPRHWLGTDELGRDIFSPDAVRRAVFAGDRARRGRRSASRSGRSLASWPVSIRARRASDAPGGHHAGFPGILLAIAIVAALGPGLISVIVAIGINEIPGFARVNRSIVLSLRAARVRRWPRG